MLSKVIPIIIRMVCMAKFKVIIIYIFRRNNIFCVISCQK